MKTSLRFVLSLLGLLIGIVILGFCFKVKNISCVIDQTEQNNLKVCQQLQSLVGSRLLFRDLLIDKSVLAATVINETGEVFSIDKVATALDGKIIFYLSQTKPLYRFSLDGNSRIFTTDGKNRADDSTIAIPTIVDDQSLMKNDFNRYHDFIANFLMTLTVNQSPIKQIVILAANKIKLVVTDYPTFVLDSAQDPKVQAKKFAVIYQQLKPKEIDLAIQEIDLRFELPVLKTNESSDSAEFLIDSQE